MLIIDGQVVQNIVERFGKTGLAERMKGARLIRNNRSFSGMCRI